MTDQALKLQSQLQQLDDKLCAKFRQRNNTNEIQVRIPEESKPEEVVEEQKGDMQKYEEVRFHVRLVTVLQPGGR